MVYISRSGGGPGVFAQMVAAFEAAKVEPRLVALNLVGPEDGTTALSSYDREMEMLGYLHTYYDGKSPLHVTLHAGELAAKYMPGSYTIPGVNHIRKAVEVAHAERIGHGVDALGETNSADLITELQQLGVMVEIGLSSNIQILEVSGPAHPLATYLQAGVPVALITDDQAVSRSSLAGEYMRAVKDQNLDYRTLKKMARTSLHKSFAPGQSLWTSLDSLQSVPECAPTDTSYYGGPSSTACQTFLTASERARMQWELERRFTAFEAAQ
jgi:adenosine deaminase